ncbi:hypothetical protein ACLOJK_037835 [Asimina triloba]
MVKSHCMYTVFNAPPEHPYGAPSSPSRPAAMAAGDESSGEGADDRSKPLKMMATTRGFRSLYLLHQSMHQMYKNAKPNSPNSPPSSMATTTDGSSFHDAVRLFSDAGEQIWPPSDPVCTTAPTSSSSTHHAQSRWVETHLAVHAKHHLCISSVHTPSASHHAHHMGHHTQRPQIAQLRPPPPSARPDPDSSRRRLQHRRPTDAVRSPLPASTPKPGSSLRPPDPSPTSQTHQQRRPAATISIPKAGSVRSPARTASMPLSICHRSAMPYSHHDPPPAASPRPAHVQ